MLILVMGLPGSGKSFFATKLATIVDAEYVSSDLVRIEMGYAKRYALTDKFLVYETMLKRVEGLLTQGRDVVVDGTFYRKTLRLPFREAAERHRTRSANILVTADEPLIMQRLKTRMSVSEADYKVYLYLRGEFQPVDEPYLSLRSTNGNISELLDKAIAYLHIPRNVPGRAA